MTQTVQFLLVLNIWILKQIFALIVTKGVYIWSLSSNPNRRCSAKACIKSPPKRSSLRANGAFLTSVWLLAIRVCPLDTVKFDLNKKQKSNHHWVVFSWVRTLFAIAIEAAGPISENVAFWCRLWIGMKWTEHCVTWFFVVSMYVWGSSIDSFDSFDQWSNRMTNNKHTIGQEDDTGGAVLIEQLAELRLKQQHSYWIVNPRIFWRKNWTNIGEKSRRKNWRKN